MPLSSNHVVEDLFENLEDSEVRASSRSMVQNMQIREHKSEGQGQKNRIAC
jgi:hypothetical protein